MCVKIVSFLRAFAQVWAGRAQVRTKSPEKLMPPEESSLNGSVETRSEAPRDDALLACLLLLARTHGLALEFNSQRSPGRRSQLGESEVDA